MNEKGSVLVLALMILTIVSLMGAFALNNTLIEMQIARNVAQATQAFYNAESGLAIALATEFDPDQFPESNNYEIAVYDEIDGEGNPTGNIIVESTGYYPSKDHPRPAITVVEAGFKPTVFSESYIDQLIEHFENIRDTHPSSFVQIQANWIVGELYEIKAALEIDEDQKFFLFDLLTCLVIIYEEDEESLYDLIMCIFMGPPEESTSVEYSMTYWMQK